MSDRYLDFSHSSIGRKAAGLLGLPVPPRLKRAAAAYEPAPLAGSPVLLAGAAGGKLAEPLLAALAGMAAAVHVSPVYAGFAPIKQAAARAGLTLKTEPSDTPLAPLAIVFDATGIDTLAGLRELYDYLQPRVAKTAANGRILILSRAPNATESPAAYSLSASLRGFVRSLGKEVGRKAVTVNLLEVGRGAEATLAGALRFFLTPHSAYVDGQVLALTAPPRGGIVQDWNQPLRGKRAVVTGAARGIGAAIAQTLAREGAIVIGVDRPQEEGALGATMSALGGQGLALDVSSPDAGARLVGELGPLDIVVHNAGITRDKMLRNMSPQHWDQVLDINLGAILRINERLFDDGLSEGGRIVCISSIGGISGNAGQTNYGATKAGIIGYCEAYAPLLATRGGAINAVAPGFIETQMTAHMPAVNREVGRRLSSLSQGGLPIDIAEAVTFLASPLAAGVNGRTLRVCGQNFMGS